MATAPSRLSSTLVSRSRSRPEQRRPIGRGSHPTWHRGARILKGTFVYLARSGDAIRLAGFLVNPAEIEDVLKAIDGVGDAQVVSVEVPGKMRAAAVVIPSDVERGIDEPAVIASAASMLAAFKVPVESSRSEAFPTTESANGLKIQKSKLRQMAADRLVPGT